MGRNRTICCLKQLAHQTWVNFMSQKLRGIQPGGILLLTSIDSFLHFWGLNVRLLSSFEETITLKLSRIYSQGEKREKVPIKVMSKITPGGIPLNF